MYTQKEGMSQTAENTPLNSDRRQEEATPLTQLKDNFSFIEFEPCDKDKYIRKKEEQNEDISFWRKWILIIVICAGLVAVVVSSIVIYTKEDTNGPNPNPSREWFKKETVYELLVESFHDSSPKAENAPMVGDGVGDINGIKDHLDYISNDVGSKILYINSMYESNDDDHMTLVDHRKINTVFGGLEDFDMLRNITRQMEMRLILDFIPNHTGRGSKWFLKSQKKEGNYSDYYIWAPCEPRTGTYPNNWMSVKRGRAWTYDETRKECFFHQLEDDKPDLNLWNPDVQKELENIIYFWLEKGVDGFHVRNVQYLYEDRNLGDEIMIPEMYYGTLHNKTWNHPENAKILQAWKSVLDIYSTKTGVEKILITTADDDLNTTLQRYIDAGVTLVRVNPLSGDAASLAERIETTLRDVDCQKIGWMFSDKYSSRLASRENPQQTKALLTLQATLPGVPFNYYGNEIGMSDHPTLSVPLKYRTPMQWNSKGTGFSVNRPWMDRNPNYKTVNVETEETNEHENTTLKVYKRLQKLRERESFRSGKMKVFRDGDLLMYTRKAEGSPGYLVAINFGSNRMTESFYKVTGIPSEVKVLFHSHRQDNTAVNLSRNSYTLDPNHAVILEYD